MWINAWSCLLTRTLKLASSNLDRRVRRFNLRPSPRSTSRTCKRTERRRCGRSHSNAQVSDWTTKYFKSNTQELSRNREPVLSQYTQELASVKKTIWTCVPQKLVGKPLYTWSLSLSWQLHIWTRGSHPAVHVPSSGASLTWALLLTLLWLSYLCMILLSA